MKFYKENLLAFGKNCVIELIRSQPKIVSEIWATPEQQQKIAALRFQGPLRHATNQQLTNMVGTRTHQGVVASITQFPYRNFQELINPTATKPLILLDGIKDPHNIGAIIRAAECFGAAGVVWSKNRGPSVTSTICKTSSGAVFAIPIALISNLADSIRKLKDAGYTLYIADNTPAAMDVDNVDWQHPCALVLGAEDGVSQIVSKLADVTVKIKLSGQIDSLNVSQAAAVILSHVKSGP